jgi:hypothetical protein
MSTLRIIHGYIGGAILLGLLTIEGIALYWARTRTKDFIKYFSNFPLLLSKTTTKEDGLILKLMFIGAIAGCVACPTGYIQRGEVSAEDLQNLPASIKKRLVIMHWTLMGLLAALPIHYAVSESGWLD